MRAGLFLNHLEMAVNQCAERPPPEGALTGGNESAEILTWEQWASIHQGARDVDRQNRWAIIIVFALLATGSGIFGYVRIRTNVDVDVVWSTSALIVAVILAFASVAWLARLVSYADAYRNSYVQDGPRRPAAS